MSFAASDGGRVSSIQMERRGYPSGRQWPDRAITIIYSTKENQLENRIDLRIILADSVRSRTTVGVAATGAITKGNPSLLGARQRQLPCLAHRPRLTDAAHLPIGARLRAVFRRGAKGKAPRRMCRTSVATHSRNCSRIAGQRLASSSHSAALRPGSAALGPFSVTSQYASPSGRAFSPPSNTASTARAYSVNCSRRNCPRSAPV